MPRPIIIREVNDGLGGGLPWKIWRAYGINRKTGREFALPDNRYPCAYPLDAITEKQLRRLCARQYPNHPIKVK